MAAAAINAIIPVYRCEFHKGKLIAHSYTQLNMQQGRLQFWTINKNELHLSVT